MSLLEKQQKINEQYTNKVHSQLTELNHSIAAA